MTRAERLDFIIRLVLRMICVNVIFGVQLLWACMSHSADDVFIARYQSSILEDQKNQSAKTSMQQYQLSLSKPRFVFRSFNARLRYSQPKRWYSHFELKSVKPEDLVIGLAYAPDQTYAKDYQLITLATLSCRNDQILLGKPQQKFLFWIRDQGRCRTSNKSVDGLLDGFLDYDQATYMRKLQARYPTCKALDAAFP